MKVKILMLALTMSVLSACAAPTEKQSQDCQESVDQQVCAPPKPNRHFEHNAGRRG
jgi:outer membrane biogenesis lipoprotein LolB